MKKIKEFLQRLSRETERVKRPCPGDHVFYSSMANDRICPICKEWEDSIGGDIITYEPTKLAKEAIELLKEL